MLRKVEERGAVETAHRTKQVWIRWLSRDQGGAALCAVDLRAAWGASVLIKPPWVSEDSQSGGRRCRGSTAR